MSSQTRVDSPPRPRPASPCKTFSPASLGGLVFFDVNNNGVRDLGELPIVGVTITLTGTASAGTNTAVNQTVSTLEDGSYKFENLAPGTYQIKKRSRSS